MDARSILGRFLILRGLRWLPTGLVIPIIVLLLTDRGLSLTQVGFVFAAQGVAVIVLELPTGGLADSVGRRPVLLVAGLFELAATALLVVAGPVWLLLIVFALQGVYRALESGPLDAWYVDSVQARDPQADIERGLARSGVIVGLTIAVGAVASGDGKARRPRRGISRRSRMAVRRAGSGSLRTAASYEVRRRGS